MTFKGGSDILYGMEDYIRFKDSGERIHYITSDTHFGHINIARLTGRPFNNENGTEGMDNALVELWNSVVTEKDAIVLHLGDAALGDIEYSLPYFGQANGRKFLVKGNHDTISYFFTNVKRQAALPIYERYFTVIENEVGVDLEVVIDGEAYDLFASHYPSAPEEYDKSKMRRLKAQHPENTPIVHGHTHSFEVINPESVRDYHVGVEAHNLKPVPAEKIIEWYKTVHLARV